MKTNLLLPFLFLVVAAISRLGAQEPTPAATPDDVPVPSAQPAAPATPAAQPTACPMCAMPVAECKDEKPTPPPEDDETVLKKLEQDWGEAIAQNNVPVLESAEADDFIYTDPTGIIEHKADQVTRAKEGATTGASFQYSDMTVRVYGLTAVVVGRCTLKWTDAGKDSSGDYRFTDVFVKRDGRWQAVASQATAIGPPAAAAETAP